jgi:glyoxylase-like metal-dependent hydrolase (beta-lactamase superfamily II)
MLIYIQNYYDSIQQMIHIQAFFHQSSNTLTYVVADQQSKQCAVVDPVLDFDIVSGEIGEQSIDEVIAYINAQSLKVKWILETHAHADHVSSAQRLKAKTGGMVAIGEHITRVQQHFAKVFNLDIALDGSQFDQLLKEGDRLPLGEYHIDVLHTPGHTPDSISYVIDGNAFVGDTLFTPDSGSARCDFPGGSASELFHSIQKLYALGDQTNLYMCHDYMPGGRELTYKMTVAQQKQLNIHIKDTTELEDYVAVREKRDATLSLPKLILPSIQLNIIAGQLPPAESNQQYYIKIPLKS